MWIAFNAKVAPAINASSRAVAGVSNAPASNHSFNCSTTKAITAALTVRLNTSAHPVGTSMLSHFLKLFIILRALLLCDPLGGWLLEKPRGAQQKLVEGPGKPNGGTT